MTSGRTENRTWLPTTAQEWCWQINRVTYSTARKKNVEMTGGHRITTERRGVILKPANRRRRNPPKLGMQQAGKWSDRRTGDQDPNWQGVVRRIGGKQGHGKRQKPADAGAEKRRWKWRRGCVPNDAQADTHKAKNRKMPDCASGESSAPANRKNHQGTEENFHGTRAQMERLNTCDGRLAQGGVTRIDAAQDAGRSLLEMLDRCAWSTVFRSQSKVHPLCKRTSVCTNEYVSPNAPRGANLRRLAKTSRGASCRVQPRLLRHSDTNNQEWLKEEIGARFIPYALTAEQQQQYVHHVHDVFEMIQTHPNFVNTIITGDKWCCFAYGLETKWQSTK